jgi:hypothetical protein
MIKESVRPKHRANLQTLSPITVPPPKETFNACGKLYVSSFVLFLTFVFVVLIPIFAKAEKMFNHKSHHDE